MKKLVGAIAVIHNAVTEGREDMDFTGLEMKNGEPLSESSPRKRTSLRIDQDLRDRWMQALNEICPDCITQQERTEKLLMWVEEQLVRQEEPQPKQEPLELDWIKDEFQALQKRLKEIEQAKDLGQLQHEIEQLHQENQRLKQAEVKLQQVDSTIANYQSRRRVPRIGGVGILVFSIGSVERGVGLQLWVDLDC